MFPFPKFFKAVGDPVRQRILFLLNENGEMPVKDLVEKLGLAQSTVSHHLSILKKAGIIKAREEGTQSYYCVCCDVISGCCSHMKNFFKGKS